jgi:hypothetical protein
MQVNRRTEHGDLGHEGGGDETQDERNKHDISSVGSLGPEPIFDDSLGPGNGTC